MILGTGIFRTKLPTRFRAGGINCGVRAYRPDLGVIISDVPATTVGVFTQNHMRAAPVNYTAQCLPANTIRAIITNSGEANAATGIEGEKNNVLMAESLAKALGCHCHQVITASTGVIGKPLSIEKITQAIPYLVKKTSDIAENFATAILTTDLVPKTVYKDLTLSGGKVRITGICKGSGMISPNMATMLGYFLTDAQLNQQEAQSFLNEVCDKSFNMVSVDGETSTNDCAFLMANGSTKVSLDTPADHLLFYQTLLDMAITLAKSIARDGEGASKLIEVKINGAANDEQAKKMAKSIINSPLIKTAIYGESPNWGRILARLGQEDISKKMLDDCAISLQGMTLFAKGCLVDSIDLRTLETTLTSDHIFISIGFSEGTGEAVAWGCDLTEKYVTINAEYLS